MSGTRATLSSLSVRASLSEEAADSLRASILSGDLAAGSRLRIEDTAERLGTSPTPVREALTALRVEGFVEYEPRKGFRVLPLAPEDIDDVFDILSFLLGEINARAASRITPEELAELIAFHERSADAASADIPRLNLEFHYAVYAAARAPKIRTMILYISRYVPTPHTTTSEWKGNARADHAALITALEERDIERARQLGISHARSAHLASKELLLAQ